MRVLVADDDRITRLMVEAWLRKWGYDVVSAVDGQSAWNVLTGPTPPPLAILDWMMPELDGPEICRRLQREQTDAFVYTILLTGKTQKEAVVEGLEAGANDFLAKPFDIAELRGRVGAGARVVRLEQALRDTNHELAEQARQLQELAEQRAKQLIHADRMASLGVMSAGIAHEINNPTSFIAGNVQTLERFWDRLSPLLGGDSERAEQTQRTLEFAQREIPAMISGIKLGVARIVSIVQGLKSFARPDEGERQTCQVRECVEQALMISKTKWLQVAQVACDLPADLPAIWANSGQIQQVLINLLVNSADALADMPHGHGRVWIQARAVEGQVELVVEDNGPGVPDALIDQIFNPFFTTKEVGKGTGLGLSISAGIIHSHGGSLRYAHRAGGGARFSMTLPCSAQEPSDACPADDRRR